MTFSKFAFSNGNLEFNLEKPLGPPRTPPGVCVCESLCVCVCLYVCVCVCVCVCVVCVGGWSRVKGWGVGWGACYRVTQNRVSRLNSRSPFRDHHFEITISRFEITILEITVVEVKPSSPKKIARKMLMKLTKRTDSFYAYHESLYYKTINAYVVIVTRLVSLIIYLRQCFSTFFGSRHPIRPKKIGCTLT